MKNKNNNYFINVIQTGININNPIVSNDLCDNSKSIIKLNEKKRKNYF